MSLSRFFQFFLGSTLGIAIMVAAGLGAGYLAVVRLSTAPPRPTFDNERGMVPKPVAKKSSTKSQEAQKNVGASPSPTANPSAEASPSPSPSPSASPEGKYSATVSYGEGLSVRSDPSVDAERIGGVDYQENIIVLEESSDQQWQRIRSEATGIEGWIKAGNIERAE
jgi:hypothetical protein